MRISKPSLHQLSLSAVIVILAVAIGALLRFYNLEDSLQFLGDQGRDALIVSRIFTEGDLVFIGPVTSVGNMYLGPLYYYFMAPFLWLTYPSPMGPVYATALIGVLTVWLMFHLGKKLVGPRAAAIGTVFFSLSATVVTYTRFSWNPNPAPLVALAMMYFTYTAWQRNRWHWVIVAGLFAVLLQLHYLTLLAAGGAGVIWLISLFQRWQQHRQQHTVTPILELLIPTVLGGGVLLLSFTPLILFDIKHDGLNISALGNLIFGENNFKIANQVSLTTKIARTVQEMHGRGMHILFEIAIGKLRLLNSLLLLSTVAVMGWLLSQGKKRKYFAGELVITAFLLTGIAGTALYEHTIFDHYIAYLFPATFLIYGVVLDWLSQKYRYIGTSLSIAFFSFFLWYNLPRMPLGDAGWTITDMQTVAASIYSRVEPGEKYNIVLLSETGDIDAQNYRYFLSTTDKAPVRIAQRGEIEKLFIINEDFALDRVVESPIYEIVVFPNKTPTEVYRIPEGPEITVLTKQ